MFNSFHCALFYRAVLDQMIFCQMTEILPAPDQYLWLLDHPLPQSRPQPSAGVGVSKSQGPMLPHPSLLGNFNYFQPQSNFFRFFWRHDYIL